jgi:hypothetical protein
MDMPEWSAHLANPTERRTAAYHRLCAWETASETLLVNVAVTGTGSEKGERDQQRSPFIS